MGFRYDFFANLPEQKPGTAEVRSPSPNILDAVILEDLPIRTSNYQPLIRGSPHPNVPAALLVFEGPIKGTENQKSVQRIYATRRSAQNPYNAKLSFEYGDINYPVYERTYFIYQDDYVAGTKAQPLAELIGLLLAGAGTGYNGGNSGRVSLTFTGGTGSGAAGYAQIVLGVPVAVVLTNGGNYTAVPTVGISGAGGTGATITAILQPASCLLADETKDNAEGEFGSIFYEVKQIYKRLPGPVRTSYEMDPETQVNAAVVEQDVLTSSVSGGAAASLGMTADFRYQSVVETEKKTSTLDATAMANFFRVFPGYADMSFPKVLTDLLAVWDTAVGTGTYTETGSGIGAGTSISFSLSLTGRGQGSGSVMPELIPVFAAQPWGDKVPVLDYYFFMPDNPKPADILTKASAIASAYLGTATTISAWPVFKPQVHTFVTIGQKISLSANAAARVSGNADTTAPSYGAVTSEGGGSSHDFGQTVRAITLPECIHDIVAISGDVTRSQAAVAGASAFVAGGSLFPSASGGGSASGTAIGSITPTALDATSPATIPATGVFGTYDTQTFKAGYCAVRVRTVDFSVIAP